MSDFNVTFGGGYEYVPCDDCGKPTRFDEKSGAFVHHGLCSPKPELLEEDE
jgi:hypothetical protein